jgi:hypothetical protein
MLDGDRVSDKMLIEVAKRFASGDKYAKKLQKLGWKVREAMEEYLRAAEEGEVPEDVLQEMVEVWIFTGIILANLYCVLRLNEGSRTRALALFFQLFSPVGRLLIAERLRNVMDIIELEEHFRRRGGKSERS